MPDAPWTGDACSLVDAYRAGRHHPAEEMTATLAAIAASELNACCHVDAERAIAGAAAADVGAPFGGVPFGVKELDRLTGWPASDASLVFAHRVADRTFTCISRALGAGLVPVAQTTASEFGGLNVSISRLHGTTYNPWGQGRTAGGSSSGSAAAVAGGLVPIASGSDGGGSIRIPAAFCGLVGLKPTFGRIPRGPRTEVWPMTVVHGCLARSVRDAARHLDVTAGPDLRDPNSLPAAGAWERGLGGFDLSGLRVAVLPDFGGAVVRPEVAAVVLETGEALVARLGARRVEVPNPTLALAVDWSMSNLVTLAAELGDAFPAGADELTTELQFAMAVATQAYDLQLAARAEQARTDANETMADLFQAADVVLCAANPDVAFGAGVTLNTRVGDLAVGPENNATLTVPANVYGNPSITVPAGTVDGLPVGLQIMAPHHREDLCLALALDCEQAQPWPLVAPGAPC
ncbi:MAG: amidase [Acidimicrobiales bacterium]